MKQHSDSPNPAAAAIAFPGIEVVVRSVAPALPVASLDNLSALYQSALGNGGEMYGEIGRHAAQVRLLRASLSLVF
jgi:hypothetical protein